MKLLAAGMGARATELQRPAGRFVNDGLDWGGRHLGASAVAGSGCGFLMYEAASYVLPRQGTVPVVAGTAVGVVAGLSAVVGLVLLYDKRVVLR